MEVINEQVDKKSLDTNDSVNIAFTNGGEVDQNYDSKQRQKQQHVHFAEPHHHVSPPLPPTVPRAKSLIQNATKKHENKDNDGESLLPNNGCDIRSFEHKNDMLHESHFEGSKVLLVTLSPPTPPPLIDYLDLHTIDPMSGRSKMLPIKLPSPLIAYHGTCTSHTVVPCSQYPKPVLVCCPPMPGVTTIPNMWGTIPSPSTSCIIDKIFTTDSGKNGSKLLTSCDILITDSDGNMTTSHIKFE